MRSQAAILIGRMAQFMLAAVACSACNHDQVCGRSAGIEEPLATYEDDFENGEARGWRTWSHGPGGEVIGGGFTLSVEGDSCKYDGELGLRLRCDSADGTEIAERDVALWPERTRISLRIRPFLRGAANQILGIGLADSTGQFNPATAIQLTPDGRVYGPEGTDTGGRCAPGDWHHLEMWLDAQNGVFGFRSSAAAIEAAAGWPAECEFGKTAVLQVRCSGEGPGDHALDDLQSCQGFYEPKKIVIHDFQYTSGQYFFLTDPDGKDMSETGIGCLVDESVEVWIDDLRAPDRQERTAAYLTLDGMLSAVRDSILAGRSAVGHFARLEAGVDFVVSSGVYENYPILAMNDDRVLDDAMTVTLAICFATRHGRVGGWLGSSPDTLVLKVIRPAAGVGNTDPSDLTQGVFARAANLELRNTYDLGPSEIPEMLSVQIRMKGLIQGVLDPDHQDDHSFLEILGLDLYTESDGLRTPGADGRVDAVRLDCASGRLRFLELQPFAPTAGDIEDRIARSGDPQRPAHITVRADQIYLRNLWTEEWDVQRHSRYYLSVRQYEFPFPLMNSEGPGRPAAGSRAKGRADR